ncbi:hypothetical protein NMYAN_100009 [Nitrosomonas nitrosa]|uniref:Uncharacterized protein n=1 Tax=Nitrosomonas nitrosa TaxID=52442 RepID=A0A8H8YZC0_9PROT|nr:hypothetical protein NMYAN_100009 [Nitrosomonas nitrosa]
MLVSADRLNFYLSGHGYQVYMEDETSLLGQNLTDALPLRIGDCEVFYPDSYKNIQRRYLDEKRVRLGTKHHFAGDDRSGSRCTENR